MRLKCVALAAVALSSTVYASNPFIGKWKIDEAKSHFTGATDSVTAAGANTWKFQYGALSWTLKADGTDQPTPFGTTAMKVTGPTTWEFVNNVNGKLSSTETWTLSADGNSITRAFTVQQGTGQPSSGHLTVKRVGGTSGFEGTWESTELQMTFTEVDVEPNGDDGVTLRLPEDGTHYSLKFDGKEYPEESQRLPAGTTVSARRLGPRKVKATTKLNGKPFDTEDWEISADGGTFTYTQLDAGTTNPTVVVLHRMEH